MLDRGLSDVTPLTVGIASLLITNLASLLVAIGIYALVRAEFGDRALARRTVWLMMLAPPAFVFVMGYSESVLVLLAIAFFVAIRRGSWWWAGLFGYLAGTARPIGSLLFVPALIEVIRSWPTDRWSRWPGKVVAIVSSVAGTVTYLGWVSAEFGGFFEPLKIQQQQAHHGTLADPVVTISHALTNLAHGHHIGDALHVPWIVIVVVLLVVAFWRLPVSYAAFALCIVVVALSGSNLDSFERYAFECVPPRDRGRDPAQVRTGRRPHLRAVRRRHGHLRRLGVSGGLRPVGVRRRVLPIPARPLWEAEPRGGVPRWCPRGG